MRISATPSLAFVILLIMMIMAPLVWSPVPVQAFVQGNGYSGNGNQELLVDQESGLIFFSNPADEALWIWDGVSDPSGRAVDVGLGPMSIDLNDDGSLLYVTSQGENMIYVVDIEGGTVQRTIPLDFSPLSVREGEPGILYVSEAGGVHIRAVNATSGAIIASAIAEFGIILEASPDNHQLMAVSKSASPLKAFRYNISNGGLALVAQDQGDLTGDLFRQMAVDWEGGFVYVADRYGINVLGLDSLQKVRRMSILDATEGISLFKERGMVLAASNAWYGSYITFFAMSDGANLGTMDSPAYAGPMAMSPDSMSVLIGAPFPTVVPLYTTLHPRYPSPSGVYGYTPSYMEVGLDFAYYVPPLNPDLTMLVNHVPVDRIQDGFVDSYRGSINQSLPDGIYDVNVTLHWNEVTRWSNWSFTINRSIPSAVMPEVISLVPGEEAMLNTAPNIVDLFVNIPAPEPLTLDVEVLLDGTGLPVVPDPYDYGRFQANIAQIDHGRHAATVRIITDGKVTERHWNFTYFEAPSVRAIYPVPSSSMTQVPTYFEAELYLGDPAATHLSHLVSFDGQWVPADLLPSGRLRGIVTWGMEEGTHNIVVSVETSAGTYSASWSFLLDLPPELLPMTIHNDPHGYRLPVPSEWSMLKNQSLGGQTYDLILNGPTSGGITANIMVQSGNDATVRETEQYLDHLIDDIRQGLADQGAVVSILESPEYIQVANHSAAVFSVKWTDYPIVQKLAIILDEEHFRYWFIFFTVGEIVYDDLDLTFDAMIEGFQVTLEPAVGKSEMGFALILGAIGVVAVVGGLVFVLIRRKGRRAG